MTLLNCVSHELLDAHTIAILSLSKYNFYQTGSRYFGTYTSESDWDFYTENSYEVRSWLENHGFEQCNGNTTRPENYFDGVTIRVYKRDNIHVQLVNDLQRKHAMQNLLRNSGVLAERIDKAVAKKLWKLAWWATKEIV